MRVSNPARRKAKGWQRAIAVTLVALMIGPFSPALAGEVGEHVREAIDDSLACLVAKAWFTSATPLQPQDTPQERAAQVSSIQLCPRQLKLYAEETFAFVPVGMDKTQNIVHGVSLQLAEQRPCDSQRPGNGRRDGGQSRHGDSNRDDWQFSSNGNRTSAGRSEV